MRASLTGFQTAVIGGIQLVVGQEAVIDISLKVGATSQEITVTAEAPLIDTTSSALANIVDDQKIRELPVNGRSFTQLAVLQPGVVSFKNFVPNGSGGRALDRLSINGLRPNQNSFLLDGTDINPMYNNAPSSIAGVQLGIDTVREYQVVSSTSSAEYGRAAGGVINAVTRSGTNSFHGSLFEFLRNDKFDAKNFFDAAKPEFRRNQFGGTLGGPIVVDKTFFFFGYEGFRESLGITQIATVPSAAARASAAANVVPYLALYPTTFIPGSTNGQIAQAQFVFIRPTREDNAVLRVDHKFSDRNLFFARYTFDDAHAKRPEPLPDFQEEDRSRNQYVTLQLDTTVRTNLLNTARFAFNRSGAVYQDIALAPNMPAPFIPGAEFGTLDVGGLTSAGTNFFIPIHDVQNLYQISDNMTYVKGRHSLKWGLNIEKFQWNYRQEFVSGGRWLFASLSDFLSGSATPFVDFFFGTPLVVNNVARDSFRNARKTLFGIFIQDDFKVNARFTANFGLRYDPSTNMTEAHGKFRNILNPLTSTGVDVSGNTATANGSFRNFAPRIGFSWDPTGSGRQATAQVSVNWYKKLLG